MTDRELRYIKTISEYRSFSKAAQKLYMTQPSLSQCVANLEKELGTPLFVRSTKGLTLTFAGERYYESACEILDIYEDMTQEICEIGELKRGRIRLGITNYLSTLLLPIVLPSFAAKYPGIEISLLERNSSNIEEMLVARRLDFAVIHTCEADKDSRMQSIDFQPLKTDCFVTVLPKGSPLKKFSVPSPDGGLPVLDPKYLAGQNFIMVQPEQRIRQVCDMILKKASVTPHIALTTRNYDTARRLAGSGMGVTLIPWQYIALNCDKSDAEYYAIPPEYDAQWTLGIATVVNAYLPKACKAFINVLSDCINEFKNL